VILHLGEKKFFNHMEQNKFVLRTSGFGLYFISLFAIAGIFLLCLVAKDIAQNGLSFAKILISLLFTWIEIFMYRFIAGQKIEINKGKLSAQFIFSRGVHLLPQIQKHQINLTDISSVTIARRKYFEEHSEEFKDEGLQDVMDIYRNLFAVTVSGGIVVPMPLGFGTKYTPLMYIAPKEKSQRGITIITKPFSKNGFRNLIKELQKRNISVFTEPALGL
jgi:hypothetical protein